MTATNRFFKEAEFRGHYLRMDPKLLQVMERFRVLWGAPVVISPAPGAIGRTDGDSFHNYAKHKLVKAIDIMPTGMRTKADFARALECAKQAGATGIGIYPDWSPVPGVHLDVGVRKGRKVGNPATWAGVKQDGVQIYVDIKEVL